MNVMLEASSPNSLQTNHHDNALYFSLPINCLDGHLLLTVSTFGFDETAEIVVNTNKNKNEFTQELLDYCCGLSDDIDATKTTLTHDTNATTTKSDIDKLVASTQHTEEDLFNEPITEFSCRKCSLLFDDKNEYISHIKSHDIIYECDKCGLCFRRHAQFVQHYSKHTETSDITQSEVHTDEQVTLLASNSDPTIMDSQWREFKCRKCDYISGNVDVFISHSSISHPNERAECPICGKILKHTHNLRRHISIHYGIKPYVCVICSKSFMQEIGRKAHMLSHDSRHKRAKKLVRALKTKSVRNAKVVPTVRNKGLVKDEIIGDRYANFLSQDATELLSQTESNNPTELKDECSNAKSAQAAMETIEIGKVDATVIDSVDKYSEVSTSNIDFTHGHSTNRDTFIQPSISLSDNEGIIINSLTFANIDAVNVVHPESAVEGIGMKKVEIFKFVCDICNQQFKYKQGLRRHTLIHANAQEFQCDSCVKSFCTKEALKKHTDGHINRRFNCSICDAKFARRQTMLVHELSHEKAPKTCIKYHNCTIHPCLRKFTTPNELAEHIKTEHPCPVCGRTFIASSSLNRHMLTHNDDRNYHCPICGKRYKYEGAFNDHVMTHFDKDTLSPCPFCSRSFARGSFLRGHIENQHNGANPWKCSECDKVFKLKSLLNHHILSHSRPHPCSHCTKSFATKQLLEAHLATASGVKNFECPQCKKRFAHKFALKTHMIVHSGKLDHQCMICGARFARVSQINRHLISHQGDRTMKCDVCSKTFMTKAGLTVHMTTHSNNRPFGCDVCNKRFKTRQHMTRHAATHMLAIQAKQLDIQQIQQENRMDLQQILQDSGQLCSDATGNTTINLGNGQFLIVSGDISTGTEDATLQLPNSSVIQADLPSHVVIPHGSVLKPVDLASIDIPATTRNVPIGPIPHGTILQHVDVACGEILADTEHASIQQGQVVKSTVLQQGPTHVVYTNESIDAAPMSYDGSVSFEDIIEVHPDLFNVPLADASQ